MLVSTLVVKSLYSQGVSLIQIVWLGSGRLMTAGDAVHLLCLGGVGSIVDVVLGLGLGRECHLSREMSLRWSG